MYFHSIGENTEVLMGRIGGKTCNLNPHAQPLCHSLLQPQEFLCSDLLSLSQNPRVSGKCKKGLAPPGSAELQGP